MKKKAVKKLSLGKIKIASLRKAEQAMAQGGAGPLNPITVTVATTDPTAQTWCFICPVSDWRCI